MRLCVCVCVYPNRASNWYVAMWQLSCCRMKYKSAHRRYLHQIQIEKNKSKFIVGFSHLIYSHLIPLHRAHIKRYYVCTLYHTWKCWTSNINDAKHEYRYRFRAMRWMSFHAVLSFCVKCTINKFVKKWNSMKNWIAYSLEGWRQSGSNKNMHTHISYMCLNGFVCDSASCLNMDNK